MALLTAIYPGSFGDGRARRQETFNRRGSYSCDGVWRRKGTTIPRGRTVALDAETRRESNENKKKKLYPRQIYTSCIIAAAPRFLTSPAESQRVVWIILLRPFPKWKLDRFPLWPTPRASSPSPNCVQLRYVYCARGTALFLLRYYRPRRSRRADTPRF